MRFRFFNMPAMSVPQEYECGLRHGKAAFRGGDAEVADHSPSWDPAATGAGFCLWRS